jgi:hypothetical protein
VGARGPDHRLGLVWSRDGPPGHLGRPSHLVCYFNFNPIRERVSLVRVTLVLLDSITVCKIFSYIFSKSRVSLVRVA